MNCPIGLSLLDAKKQPFVHSHQTFGQGHTQGECKFPNRWLLSIQGNFQEKKSTVSCYHEALQVAGEQMHQLSKGDRVGESITLL